MLKAVAVFLIVFTSAIARAADHPEWKQLAPLLGQPIESMEVQAFVKKYHLRKGNKFDEGHFYPKDFSYSLLFRENHIVAIVLQASPRPKGYGDPHWQTYSQPLPGKLEADDNRQDVEKKFGKSNDAGENRWVDKGFLIWVHFAEDGLNIDELFISPAPKTR